MTEGIAPDAPGTDLLVTGAPEFVRRYRFLVEALRGAHRSVRTQPDDQPSGATRIVFGLRGRAYGRVPGPLLRAADALGPTSLWHPRTYDRRTMASERRIAAGSRPDAVLHLFGLHAPFRPGVLDIPYAMLLDYTTALARRTYPPWAPFSSARAYRAWTDREREAYQGAARLFTFGPATRESLIEDYGADPARVAVVGAGGQFAATFQGKRGFGSHRMVVNASDVHRKGADRALAALTIVRKQMPDATLVVVGTRLREVPPGVENPGAVTPECLAQLLLGADLALAPARCDPYPGFLIEALNYGTPGVTSGVDGGRHILAEGRCGAVLDDASPEPLATAVLSLLGDTARLERLSEEGRKRVRDNLNWTTVGHRIVEGLAAI